MFRIGGSTEGITSGLSRQGYKDEPSLVIPNDIRKQTMPRRTNVYDFMTQFGLNLASTPSQGGIFQQVATAAKDPYAQFQTRRAEEEERDFQRQLYDEKFAFEKEKFEEEKSQFGQKLEQDRYLGELAAEGEKQFLEKQIDNYWDPIIEAETDPIKKEQLEKDKASEKYKIIVEGFDVSDQYKILTNEAAYSQALTAAERELGNTPNPKTGENWTETDPGYQEKLQELINKYLRLAAKFLEEEEREGGATGGRIGYQNAGAVMPGQPMQAQAAGPTDQGETNQINISYEQLRERLPQEISNEIVLLLSQSYEAFADFAEIQTQADVNEFNTKYNVQLFLPKQSGA
jgi:hypothetical protein